MCVWHYNSVLRSEDGTTSVRACYHGGTKASPQYSNACFFVEKWHNCWRIQQWHYSNCDGTHLLLSGATAGYHNLNRVRCVIYSLRRRQQRTQDHGWFVETVTVSGRILFFRGENSLHIIEVYSRRGLLYYLGTDYRLQRVLNADLSTA